jgi:hypothetical protein
MNILINGDSNMAGAELENLSMSIGAQLCKRLNAKEINIALGGASNDRIYNSTIEYLTKHKNIDFVVIGWSDAYRTQWFIEEHDNLVLKEVNLLGIGTLPEKYIKRKEHWYKVAATPERCMALNHYWHERIYNVHKYLEFHKIPHLFFNAFHDFTIEDSQYYLDWSHRFFGPYDPHLAYTRWAQLNGYQEITPGQFHYEPAAHQAWAQMMFDHIQKHSLLKL